MGKAALFFVASAILMLGMRAGDLVIGGMITDGTQTEYEEAILAREIATSAFNVGGARLRQSFETYRPQGEAVLYADGTYNIMASGPADGPVTIWATGVVGRAVHQVTGTFEKTGQSPFAALTLDGPVGEFDIRGKSYLISGMDTDPPSGLSLGEVKLNGMGLHSVLPETDANARTIFEDYLVVGADGDGAFSSGAMPIGADLSALLAEAYADTSAIRLSGAVEWGPHDDIGSPTAPAVVIVEGDVVMKGSFEGYGLLVVDGSLETASSGTPKWEGLVVLTAQGGTFRTRGNPQFWGAVVVQSVTDEGETGGEADAGLQGGHFDVSVFTDHDNKATMHDHQYDDRYDSDGLNLVRLGCDVDGGLCWEETVVDAGLSSVRLELRNPPASGVSYRLETTSASWSGPVTSGLSFNVNPAQVTAFDLTIDAVCSLPAAKPSHVAGDTAGRDGALTAVAVDPATGDDLWEVVVYHHTQGASCGSEENPDLVDVPPMDVVIEFAGNPRFQLSAAALKMVSDRFEALDIEAPRIVMTDARESVN